MFTEKLDFSFHFNFYLPFPSHLIQFGLLAGKWKGEAKRQLLVFDAHFFEKIGQTFSDVVEKLEEK